MELNLYIYAPSGHAYIVVTPTTLYFNWYQLKIVLKFFLRNEERYFFLILTRYFQLTSVLGWCHYRTIINYHAVLITTLSSIHLAPIVEYCSVLNVFINHPLELDCELIIVFFQVTWCKLVCKSSREEVVHKVLLRMKKSRNAYWKYLFM